MIRHLPIKRTLKTLWWCSRGQMAVGKIRAVFHGLEMALGEWVVVGDAGREWLLLAPRSASGEATGFEIMGEPRSGCRVS
jgi:hypothetical protein